MNHEALRAWAQENGATITQTPKGWTCTSPWDTTAALVPQRSERIAILAAMGRRYYATRPYVRRSPRRKPKITLRPVEAA